MKIDEEELAMKKWQERNEDKETVTKLQWKRIDEW